VKTEDLMKLLIRCRNEYGNVEVYLQDDEHNETPEKIEGAEFDGKKLLLTDLTRTQDNYMNSLDEE